MIDVTLIDGKRFKHTDMKKKALVVHFWATWCPSCKAEASNIESISKEYEVLSIAVNSGTDKALNGYMMQNGYTFRVLNDRQGKWAEKFRVDVFPTTFIYDAKGMLKFTEVGYTSLFGLRAALES
ncbi:MAG: redoxin domain-containing protein [Sulfurimonas sp.]